VDSLPTTKFLPFWGHVPTIGTDWREISHLRALSCAKFHMNRCNESPLWGENADFRPVSKLKTSWRRFVASCR